MSKAVCNNDCLNCIYDDCIKGDSNNNRQERKEYLREYYREYYKKNKEKYREYHRVYREKHRKELIAKSREYYRLYGCNKDRKDYAKAYYEAHKQEILARQKAKIESDPEKIEKRKAYMREYNKNYKRKSKAVI